MKRLSLVLVTLLLGACASFGGNEPNPTETRLNALESENRALRAQLTEQERRLNGLGAVELGSSVAGIEEKLRLMRGEVEELGYRMEQQQQRQRALYVDLDQRISRLEGGEGGASSGSRPAMDDNADQKAYLAAFQRLKAGDYAAAVKGFDELLGSYPESPYAPNAQYWIGEAHYVQRDFDAAWRAFARVLERYPASSKAPDALLKQGLLRVEQGKSAEARTLLQQTVQRFPNSSAAGLAQERLRQMGAG